MAIKDPGEAPDLNDVLKLIASMGGGSTVSDYNSGGNKGKAEADKVKRFVKTYRNLLLQLYPSLGMGLTPWQKKVMAVAAKNELAGSTFLAIVRKYDPRYVRSDDYKDRAARANIAWKKFFPQAKHAPNGLINGYARSTHDSAWLEQRLMQSNAVRKNYKFMGVAATAGSQAGTDPADYRAYREALNSSYRNYLGREATPLEQRMMFHSGMTDTEFQTALANVFGGTGSFRWAQGYVPPTRQLQGAAFKAKSGDPLYGAIAQSRETQQKFLGSQFKPYDLGLDEETGNIAMPRI